MQADVLPLLLSALFGGAVSSAGWLVGNAVRLGRLEGIVEKLEEGLVALRAEVLALDAKVDRLIERNL